MKMAELKGELWSALVSALCPEPGGDAASRLRIPVFPQIVELGWVTVVLAPARRYCWTLAMAISGTFARSRVLTSLTLWPTFTAWSAPAW